MATETIKQVIVIRKDLKMRKGKMVAQGAHASMAVFFDRAGFKHPESEVMVVEVTPEMKAWALGLFTKICVGVDSEEELIQIWKEARNMDIPCSLIKDAGLTEFGGVPTYTAVAIGPDEADLIDTITGHLKLL